MAVAAPRAPGVASARPRARAHFSENRQRPSVLKRLALGRYTSPSPLGSLGSGRHLNMQCLWRRNALDTLSIRRSALERRCSWVHDGQRHPARACPELPRNHDHGPAHRRLAERGLVRIFSLRSSPMPPLRLFLAPPDHSPGPAQEVRAGGPRRRRQGAGLQGPDEDLPHRHQRQAVPRPEAGQRRQQPRGLRRGVLRRERVRGLPVLPQGRQVRR